MATKSERQRKWEASLREYAQAGDYRVWRVGYLARNADQEFLVYPTTVTAEEIGSWKLPPLFRAPTYKKLLARWNDPMTWAKR
jgi:hypothetical protein